LVDIEQTEESTVPKHLHTFVTTLATGIVMTAVDSNRY